MVLGQRFSLLYLNQGEQLKDSTRFRNRIKAFYYKNIHKIYSAEIKNILQTEAGIEIPYIGGFGFSVTEFFIQNELRDVLDGITLIYQELNSEGDVGLARQWKLFVSRAMQEENLGYRLDAKCGVHYFVDEEFDRNRLSTLAALSSKEHLGVRAAYEAAYRYLDSTPPDTKASARSIFEAIEIISKQLVVTKNLNKWLLENTLKDLAISTLAKDQTQQEVISKMFDGFGQWVDGMHMYRHGQPDFEPVAPSEELIVYMLSSGTSFLRLILEIDKNSKKLE